MAEIVELDLVGERAKKVRRVLGRCVRNAISQHGGDIAGFALVSWDMRGNARSAILDNIGPIGPALVPTYVHDALNRHIAVDMANDTAPMSVPGE